MSTPYFKQLITMAQVGGELSSIQYDLQQASTALALQDVVKRLFNVVSYMLYHVIHDTAARMPEQVSPQAIEPVRSPAPPPSLAPQSPMHSSFGLPGLGLPGQPPTISQPGLAPPVSTTGMPGIAPSNVANVVITPQGTQVIPQAGSGLAPVTLPPNTAVDLAHMTGNPELTPAPPGVAQVVLPPGGALPPDVAAALASR